MPRAVKPGFSELFKAAVQTVKLCEVKPTEKVLLYYDTPQNPTLVEAFHTACLSIGCEVTTLRTPAGFPDTDPPATALAAMKAADIIIDLATVTWNYAPATAEVLASGTRILMMTDVLEENIAARPPIMEVYQRAQKAREMLQEGHEFRVTTPEGTDFTARRGDRPALCQKGFVNEPGTTDLYANTTIAFAPIETEAEGTLFLNGPQILYPQYCYVVDTPVRLEVAGGRIVQIDASHEDGRIFKRWIEQFEDPNCYVIAHFGFSLDHRSRDISRFDLSEWESLYGATMVAFGANDSYILGGANRAKGHADCLLLNSTFYIDGKAVLVDGEFTEESGLRPQKS